MKAVFVGGGSLRLLGILRGALAEPAIFDDGEISLYDLDVTRAQAMAQMIRKTPEFAHASCKITCDANLHTALHGADMVGVILMAGSLETFQLGDEACYRRGFIPSDNVSPNGAFLAIKGAPILLNLARLMTKHCPQAWLVNFANPVAVLSAMINNHTKINAMGVCAGYTNHQWDLARIFGSDEQGDYFDVETAGINHLSFIVKGTMRGRDLFASLDRRLSNGWRMPPLDPTWCRAYQRSIPLGIKTLIRFYKELGVLIFSSEGDGMMHLQYDRALEDKLKTFKPSSTARLKQRLRSTIDARKRADANFRSYLTKELDGDFWKAGWREPGAHWSQRQDRDIFVEILRGLAGVRKVKVVTSRPNQGAVKGYTDRMVLEYSQTIDNGKCRAAGNYEVPPVVAGIVSSLATHQTLLADALATKDPKLLAHALLSYPVQPFSRQARKLYKDLIKINAPEIPSVFRQTIDYL